MNRRLFDGDHATIALGLNNMATAWYALGKTLDAEPLFQQAVDMTKRLYPDGHPDTVVRMINLARCRDKLGRRAEALAVARDAAETAKRILPDGHPIHGKCDGLLSDLTAP